MCEPNPCLHGGACTPSPHATVGYICSCLPDYAGPKCEFVRDGKLLSRGNEYLTQTKQIVMYSSRRSFTSSFDFWARSSIGGASLEQTV